MTTAEDGSKVVSLTHRPPLHLYVFLDAATLHEVFPCFILSLRQMPA